ncbi:MAG: NADH-quinone oxidoreductase subunit L [Xanthomonadaceae bacterium]|nr:NADH-quinone oxidoreductase subunit L [Xanthomonadaceae bacterium]
MLVWILLLPLIGFLINGCSYAFIQASGMKKKISATVSGLIGTTAIVGSFIVSLILFLDLFSQVDEQREITQVLFNWIKVGPLLLDFTLRLDSLSTLFTLVITGVGSFIHIYSIGYMGHDDAPAKFFAYLNLFCFAMLALVLGASLPVMFLGWEGVGLCSYLLIGFWYADDEKAIAGKKAFIVNRIGDLGFILGMFVLYTTFGTLDFLELKVKVLALGHTLSPDMLYLITSACLLLFVGCTGKSAQIPLYVWLPDAMAGPTPVSALIHAATMVTSGIYLVTRLNFLFSLSPIALEVMAWVGALTAFFAATIAVVQTDIKKVLAYSTVSQLGYMFLGCGVAAYSAGVFHVITHAFFKALLFLSAGSVIHGMSEEQNILKMGGLKKYMPQTFFVFLIGWLAICGIPPFSGFFSKDEILWKAFSSEHGSKPLWFIAAVTAVMTAFYMTRMFILTFLGEMRSHDAHPHDSPAIMTVPLFFLAILSAVGGILGIPHMNWLDHWLSPTIPSHGYEASDSTEWVLMGLSVAGAIFGIVFSFSIYRSLKKAEELKESWSGIHRVLFNKWYVDEAYFAAIVNPFIKTSQFLWKVVDVKVVDRIVMSFGRVSSRSGEWIRTSQTGLLQVYAIVFVMSIVFTLGYIIYGLAR